VNAPRADQETIKRRVRDLAFECMGNEIEKLTKENEKLKTALDDIVRRDSCRSSGPAIECRECAWCIAVQALGGGK